MTVVRYNESTCEYNLIDSRTGAVLEDGITDRGAAEYLAHTYNEEDN